MLSDKSLKRERLKDELKKHEATLIQATIQDVQGRKETKNELNFSV